MPAGLNFGQGGFGSGSLGMPDISGILELLSMFQNGGGGIGGLGTPAQAMLSKSPFPSQTPIPGPRPRKRKRVGVTPINPYPQQEPVSDGFNAFEGDDGGEISNWLNRLIGGMGQNELNMY